MIRRCDVFADQIALLGDTARTCIAVLLMCAIAALFILFAKEHSN